MKILKLSDAIQLKAYRRHAEVRIRIAAMLTGRISREAIDECGQCPGIIDGNRLIVAESEMPLINDYLIHCYVDPVDGQTVVEKSLEDQVYAPDSDEFRVLKSMENIKAAIYKVERKRPGFGVWCKNVLDGEQFFLKDIGLSHSAPLDAVLASHLLPYEEGYVTTGSLVPFTAGTE